MMSFEVECSKIANMSQTQFTSKIVFKKNAIVRELGKLLKISHDAIERLKPIRTQNGALFMFNIESTSLTANIDNINSKLAQVTLILVYTYTYDYI